MAKIDSAFFDIGTLDSLACRDSAIHRLDPRAKLVTTLIFILVVSFGRQAIPASYTELHLEKHLRLQGCPVCRK